MGDDLVPVLAKFHREVLLPDVKRIVTEAVEASERRLRDEIHSLFDSLRSCSSCGPESTAARLED